MRFHPNWLTIGRLFAAPCLALAFVLLPRPLADWVALFLFVGAAATDWLDGRIARARGQVTAFGRMLDPVADKAMVIIALSVLIGLSGLNPQVLIPCTAILFREIVIAGLREHLGAGAGALAVTRLAKWKTTAQMAALPLLFLAGILQLRYEALWYSHEPAHLEAILAGTVEDEIGLIALGTWYEGVAVLGKGLLWVAAALTLVTGIDYFRRALPHLRETRT
ncbi:MAG: CDP-diacylglycerol--glycerol-3-phosphate 3-phosphatidyltransferase [Pseudomonadota bacterium]